MSAFLLKLRKKMISMIDRFLATNLLSPRRYFSVLSSFAASLLSPSSSFSHRKNHTCSGCTKSTKKQGISFISDTEIQSEFSHNDQAVSRMNNGSFGSCPNSVISARQNFQLQFLDQPDDFYFNTLKPSIFQSHSIIRSPVNACSIDKISLVYNVTTVAVIVLQNYAWGGLHEGRFNKGDITVQLKSLLRVR